MTEGTWPEQEIVSAWLAKHGISVPFAAQFELQEQLTALRGQPATRLLKWLDNNTTFFDVARDLPPNIPALATVAKRIWYHASDDQESYPFSAVIEAALRRA
jgi:hypothetical protein